MIKESYDFNDLLEIMKKLRTECPWDKEQTHDSLKINLIEEAYEVLEAVELGRRDKLSEELGDLLLQVIFHAQIGSDENTFDINDVIDGICKKLVYRHPHIFADTIADTTEKVLQNWKQLKKKEKGLKSQTGVMKDVPSHLPALMRSYKIQQKAAQVGFDWDHSDSALEKVVEELEELKVAYENRDLKEIENELGDAIFSLVNLARFFKIQPELALQGTIKKFISRFEYIESQALKSGKRLEEMTLEEMDVYWDEAKRL